MNMAPPFSCEECGTEPGVQHKSPFCPECNKGSGEGSSCGFVCRECYDQGKGGAWSCRNNPGPDGFCEGPSCRFCPAFGPDHPDYQELIGHERPRCPAGVSGAGRCPLEAALVARDRCLSCFKKLVKECIPEAAADGLPDLHNPFPHAVYTFDGCKHQVCVAGQGQHGCRDACHVCKLEEGARAVAHAAILEPTLAEANEGKPPRGSPRGAKGYIRAAAPLQEPTLGGDNEVEPPRGSLRRAKRQRVELEQVLNMLHQANANCSASVNSGLALKDGSRATVTTPSAFGGPEADTCMPPKAITPKKKELEFRRPLDLLASPDTKTQRTD